MMASKDPSDTIADIQEDLGALRDDLSKLMKQMTALAGETRDDAASDMKARVKRVRKGIDNTVADLGERGRESLSQVSETVIESIDESLHNHPIATLGIALGLGFVFGSMSARR
jgi:ElaB/YqjD/DUF883 family membrane-anchored ribosome-binding protein